MADKEITTELVVLGSGPGGYTAAFRAADLGKKVTLVEYYENVGGVCLNVGCIPSKALLHSAKVINEAKESEECGITFSKPKIDLDKIRNWKNKVIGKLTTGLKGLSKLRKVNIINGLGKFTSDKTLEVETKDGITKINFEYAIVATGSKPIKLPFLPEDERIIDSTCALELKDIPKKLLIIGGGIIGMEMGTVYSALGSKVSVVELTAGLLPGVDRDLVKPLQKRMEKHFDKIMLETKVVKAKANKEGIAVTFADKSGKEEEKCFDKVLSCVGRSPNGKGIGLELAGVNVNEHGFVITDSQQRTNVNNIFAIGDVAIDPNTENPMLAHRAIPQGKIAAEVVCGENYYFDPKCIPSVAYTDPEVAWVGVTEEQAKEKKLNYGKGVFPWAASGRSLATGRDEGITKVLFDKDTQKVIGAGIVGNYAGDLIAEVTLAIEMGADAEDLALTIHPHPTVAETICQASEMFEGTITDLLPAKK